MRDMEDVVAVCRTLVQTRLDAAMKRGDLDESLKWDAAMKALLSTQTIPVDNAFVFERDQLRKRVCAAEKTISEKYDSLRTQLTRDGELLLAKAVRDEWEAVLAKAEKEVCEAARKSEKRDKPSPPAALPTRAAWLVASQDMLQRPKDCVQNASLDNAWKNYDRDMKAVADECRRRIQAKLDDAKRDGDLDEALKWDAALRAFASGQTIPIDEEFDAERVTLRTMNNAAKKALADAYDSLKKQLTEDGSLDVAKAVRDEWVHVSSARGGVQAAGQPGTAATHAIDLLAVAQLPGDAISGQWERVGNGIVVHNDGNCARLCFPVALPKEYEVTMSFTRNQGNQGLGLYATHLDAAFLVQVSAADGQWATLNEIKGGPPCKVQSPELGSDQHDLVVTVRDEGVTASLDGRLLFKRSTDYRNIVSDRYGFAASRLGLISWFNDVTFHRVELLDLSR